MKQFIDTHISIPLKIYWCISYQYTNLTKVRPLFTLSYRGSDNSPLLVVFKGTLFELCICILCHDFTCRRWTSTYSGTSACFGGVVELYRSYYVTTEKRQWRGRNPWSMRTLFVCGGRRKLSYVKSPSPSPSLRYSTFIIYWYKQTLFERLFFKLPIGRRYMAGTHG